ncbi:MAG: type IV toxin-antitoxin system AbiEi family antitoxin domain-containing protein [Candidatus Coatesbacteria bacterium]
MDLSRLERIRAKPWFTAADAARALGLRRASARVAVSRWCRRGLLHRLKHDFYVYAPDWSSRSIEERFRIAAFLRVPSYVSLQTALGYHGVSTQVQRDVVESVCLRRPSRHRAGGAEFRFHKTRPALFGGFTREDGFFIATPEKALVDAVHLTQWGSYALDAAALSLRRFDRGKLLAALRPYPRQTADAVRSLCRI